MIEVLAEQAPDLREALERARAEGLCHVILDGKAIAPDRCNEPALSVTGEVIDLRYSGKAHTHGWNIQAVLAPDRFPPRVSPVEPGPVHDITAARVHAGGCCRVRAAITRRGFTRTDIEHEPPAAPGMPGWFCIIALNVVFMLF